MFFGLISATISTDNPIMGGNKSHLYLLTNTSNETIEEDPYFPLFARQYSQASSKCFSRRCRAFFVDIMIVLLLKKLLVSSYLLFVQSYVYQLPFKYQSQFIDGLKTIDTSLFLTLLWGYFMVCYVSGGGQTVGKLIFNLKVVPSNFFNNHIISTRLSVRQALMRTMGTCCAVITLGASFFINMLRQDNKGIADFFSGTEVADEKLIRAIKAVKQKKNENPSESNASIKLVA